MNAIFLSGNLTEEPSLNYTGQGTPVSNATLATNERYKNREGELVEEATFHDLVIWGKQAEVISEYADKGQYLVVRGTVTTNKWEDRDGNSRQNKEVKVLEFDFGPKGTAKQDSGGGQSQPSQSRAQSSGGQSESSGGQSQGGDSFEPDDDLPF